MRAGRVRVNDRVERDPSRWVDLDGDRLAVDGLPIAAAAKLHIVLHKPRGYVTSFGDPEGRKTVYELLDGVGAWVGPVGRLDRDTSGLLLFTNDALFAERITNPRSRLEKTYRVRTGTPIGEAELSLLREGVELDDGPTLPARATLAKSYASYSVLELAILEGRNRQVRRMLRAVGSRVRELKRIAIGPVHLGDLESGRWRMLTGAEVRALSR